MIPPTQTPAARPRALLLVPLMVLSACIQLGPQDDSDDQDDTPPPFAGTWLYSDPLFDCVRSLIFFKREGSDAYEIDLGCSLATGGVGVQVEAGEFTVGAEDEVMFVPTQTTCPGERVVPHTRVVEQLSDTLLRVTTPQEGPLLYEKARSTGFGPNLVLGCFARDGSFTPRALTNL